MQSFWVDAKLQCSQMWCHIPFSVFALCGSILQLKMVPCKWLHVKVHSTGRQQEWQVVALPLCWSTSKTLHTCHLTPRRIDTMFSFIHVANCFLKCPLFFQFRMILGMAQKHIPNQQKRRCHCPHPHPCPHFHSHQVNFLPKVVGTAEQQHLPSIPCE